ncbi:hypothetical protein [Nocardioides jiangxiensis]|uniref:Restriction endonuclease n=1 Tax=Nocardioides jiangxiensis TaxID=3064524 RepID=A0ABT9B004_9ACTN|nr:hypothetical protein [Nocardioides sp. WY-20]MDO7868176.1 hypothetical protein [Nocardioides sp. WY-20]
MELQDIVNRYAEAAEYIDLETDVERANPRTGEVYHVSFKSLAETKAVDAIDAMWALLHPGELITPADERVGVKYPKVARAKCDHVFTVDATDDGSAEWGLEVKKIEFIGNNGGANDFGVGKMLSPYLKDRGLLHDAARLRQYGFTKRVGVIGYAFGYDEASCDEALTLHPEAATTIAAMKVVVRRNGGTLYPRPLIEFTDAILGLRGYSKGPRVETAFTAFRSPTGGHGVFFGWEIRRPWLEADYDERHPW